VANAVFFFPVGESLDVVFRGVFQTGLPYAAYYSNDLNGDGMANHIVAGHTRNDLRQPNYTQVDMRVTRTFKITKRFQVDGILDIYNLFNKADYFVTTTGYKWGTAAATAPVPAFGQLSNVDKTKTREIQLGIRLKF
jgi:hypothetical protein